MSEIEILVQIYVSLVPRPQAAQIACAPSTGLGNQNFSRIGPVNRASKEAKSRPRGKLRVGYWGRGGGKMPTVGSGSLGTKLGEAGIIILIHCAIMLLKILNVYCLK